MPSTSIKQFIDDVVFGRDDRAQNRNRFWLYAGFSIVFLVLLLAVSVLKPGT